MSERIQLKEVGPEAYKAMMALENYVKNCELDPVLKSLIKIRVSQINRCNYCIDMHSKEAVKLGVDPETLIRLAEWKVMQIFTEKERIALQVAEEITFISQNGLSDQTYQEAVRLFGENGVAMVMMVSVLINSWNRVAISTRMG